MLRFRDRLELNMDLFEAIKSRRTIRRFTADPIDDKKIEAILEAGRWAPSWANTQCCRFIVIREVETKNRIAEGLINIVEVEGGGAINPAAKGLVAAPVIIVVCAQTGLSGFRHGGGGDPATDKGDWFMFDAGLAVENMSLAAHAQGLGTVVVGAFNALQVEKLLGVPAGYRAVALMPVGVPAREAKAPPRKELSELFSRERWGNK
jgi:nitroreductase